jgi:hypothetical protein
MKIVHLIITMVLSAFSTAAAESVRGGGIQREMISDSEYKYIEVYDQGAKKNKCWEAVQESGYYYIVAKDCNSSNQYQDWYYTKYGELKNRKYNDYCVHYDVYNNNYYDYIALEKCNGGSHQAWHYIEKHFVSKYDGYCVDLCRNCGGKFEVKACDQTNADQIHKVEGYWFYGW